MASRHGKIALFIDGPNLHATGQALGFKLGLRRLLEAFQGVGAVVRAFYQATIAEAIVSVSSRPNVAERHRIFIGRKLGDSLTGYAARILGQRGFQTDHHRRPALCLVFRPVRCRGRPRAAIACKIRPH